MRVEIYEVRTNLRPTYGDEQSLALYQRSMKISALCTEIILSRSFCIRFNLNSTMDRSIESNACFACRSKTPCENLFAQPLDELE